MSATSTAAPSETVDPATGTTGGDAPVEGASGGGATGAGDTGGGTAGDPATQDPATQDPATQDPATEDAGAGAPDGGSPGGGTEGLPGWPIESTPVHGGRSWAVHLAVGAPGDPALQQVLADVQQLWPGAGLGELGCDAGAAEALGRDATEHAVAVYFPTEQHVPEFRRRWEAPVVGSARVTTHCAD